VTIHWRPLDKDEAEAEILFMRLVAGRIRHPTILPKEIEDAYNASTRRRQKASRKDYAAGYEDALEALVRNYEERTA
jgi:hypothetical protein